MSALHASCEKSFIFLERGNLSDVIQIHHVKFSLDFWAIFVMTHRESHHPPGENLSESL